MDFKNIPLSAQPAFTWMWNTTVTRDGIKKQIDEMYSFGVRSFYVLAEPEEFRPNLRRTFLKPDYMSEEYVDLVYYAYEYAKSKGMTCWLYNEGGFPSGMVCGQIRKIHPELAMKGISTVKETLAANTPYSAPCNLISAFINNKRISDGDVFTEDVEVTNYLSVDMNHSTTSMRTSIAERRNTDLFLEMTHEKLKKRFGDVMGTDIKLMFDDEAHMGSWANDLDKLFIERYGYDLKDFMPYIANLNIETESEKQARARSDYLMLCGDVMINNYFNPMREWLNKNKMLSCGHLGGDNETFHQHGNILETLREYDIPGIDEIWSQITYPHVMEYRAENVVKSCKKAYEFFPRIASSAANQQGHNLCVTETFSVSGSYLVPEEMRYVVNYQAVRGISIYNVMLISYDRTGERPLQCRPNHIIEYLGTTYLNQTIQYIARLSHILQSGKTTIKTALYYPQRTIAANGKIGNEAGSNFEQLGYALEEEGIEFDIIDEKLVRDSFIKDGKLVCDKVTYDNVFVPKGQLEDKEVLNKLSLTNKTHTPSIKRDNKKLICRSMTFNDDSEGYFIVNTDAITISDNVEIASTKTPYVINLYTGETHECPHNNQNGKIVIPINLLRGEGIMIHLTDKVVETTPVDTLNDFITIDNFSAQVIHKYYVDDENGITNEYFTDNGEKLSGLGEWDKDFSGEVKYTIIVPDKLCGDFVLDLGEVRHYAHVFINDKLVGETTLPPYRVKLENVKSGDKLSIIVSNTSANANRIAKYMSLRDIRDIGPYNGFMTEAEKEAPSGGLIGPIKLYPLK